jgi:hypothetical protein
VLDLLERLLDLGELDVERPELLGLAGAEVGAQQVAPFAPRTWRSLWRSSVNSRLAVGAGPLGIVTFTRLAARPASCLAAPSFMSNWSRVSA